MAPARDSLAVSAPAGQFQAGAVVGSRFRLDALLGQDSVSQTYRATDANRRGPAAVRVISLRTLGPAAAQLVTDIENASALVHKNLIDVLTVGREADYYFIATELLDGQTLRDFIDGKRREGRNVSFKGACNLITHVANGLESAAGLMPHGGLNPAAIWVNKAGRVKVADLGLSRTVPALARRGAPSGAPDHVYCSPEVLAGAAPTTASDVYSLGVMLYEVVTGRLPSTPFTPVSQVAADVPPIVDSILAAAFAQDPAARFASPMELRDALAAALAQPAANGAPAAAPSQAATARTSRPGRPPCSSRSSPRRRRRRAARSGTPSTSPRRRAASSTRPRSAGSSRRTSSTSGRSRWRKSARRSRAARSSAST